MSIVRGSAPTSAGSAGSTSRSPAIRSKSSFASPTARLEAGGDPVRRDARDDRLRRARRTDRISPGPSRRPGPGIHRGRPASRSRATSAFDSTDERRDEQRGPKKNSSCGPSSPAATYEEEAIDLYAIDLENEVIDLAASSTRRFGGVVVQTTIHAPDSEETRPGADVEFLVFGRGPRPTGADLEVAPPFSGSARYRTVADGPPSWLGDLAVQIPGEGELPLAGPEFRAILCGYLDTQRQRACESTVASPHIA